GSYTARFRWYDPVLGRWLSRDPAGYKDGMSLYAYVGGNPLLMVDPLGLSVYEWFFGVSNSVNERQFENLKRISSQQASRGLISNAQCEADHSHFNQMSSDSTAAAADSFDIGLGETSHDIGLGYADTAYEHTIGQVDMLGLAKPEFGSAAYNVEDFEYGKNYSEIVATATEVAVGGAAIVAERKAAKKAAK